MAKAKKAAGQKKPAAKKKAPGEKKPGTRLTLQDSMVIDNDEPVQAWERGESISCEPDESEDAE
jgi:hypothetical protein